jgi:scyllo-inositol 2-dehydrogenase (NADP+)
MSLRSGLIGFGVAGRYFHAPLINAAGIDIAAVVTSRHDEARALLPSAIVLDSSEELLRREEIDLVVIASPNQFHDAQAADALRAGKHVVVDKPLCLTAAQARELSRLATRQRRKLAVFHNRRWDSDFLTLQQLLRTGRLGEINSFHARWDRYRPRVTDRWRERAEPGAGVLYDLGSHLIDQALILFGRPQWLQADVFTQREGGVVDDGFEILMVKGSLRISLGVGSIVSDGGWRYRVHGSTASFLKSGLDPQEPQLRGGMSADDPLFGVEPAQQHGKIVTGASGEQTLIASERGRWRSFYEGVRGSIERDQPPPVSADEACATIELIEAAIASSASGRRVTL